ncbi:MAG: family protein phosphatase [Moorella sp. (in: firmicutes)]|jgi:protein phosphatase|uniref:Stp1/IreP family PP2C-type Ser/Thr phosphatase n=1 Tax=unclassified Neomoorella TaxID=2676739 RepID=UPI0010FFB1B8|nr:MULTISPECIES: Stp1/IreP family PP2C-type Ser/Thr phosphatase [unclassified Moorella (in: firmicutes)]MDK2815636.1 family protein phosphatase [Moorella sp. (in: firmicutes)]MDK2894178.1 family protein phosphatase [Moorella sp. (in: firmicutes)]GEA15091.1 protein-serine/threonine phosphatase [Moorella sp. E308F]GEA16998.1 protein-serine/threonine phosphatase [Moorella sp. E306M]
MRAEALSHTGLVRPGNEDYFISDVERGLFAVADGMGGHQAGEVASHLALRALQDRLFYGTAGEPLPRLLAAAEFANEIVYRCSLSSRERAGMGTTMTAVWIVGSRGFLVHIGDSRAYLFRDGQLQVLTNDHSYVGELVRCGGLTAEEARLHPQRNILTRALGTGNTVDIDSREIELKPGDRLLLCTDGLYEVIPDQELADIMNRHQELAGATRQLLRLALERGGPDNVTVVLALYE